MSVDAWITLGVVVVTVVLLALDRFQPALVMGGSLIILFVCGIVDKDQALAGLSNEAPITVAALYVLAGAADATGALAGVVGRVLGGAARERRRGELARVCVPSASISAFIANTPLVSMLAPRILEWCRRTGRSPSLYLMPLSYAIILGGCITMIGTSTNLFVNDLLANAGLPRLGIFDITGIGLPIAAIGVGIVVLVAPRVLRPRTTPDDAVSRQGREFTVEMSVSGGGPLAGVSVADAELRNLQGVFLVAIERNGRSISPVTPQDLLEGGDHLSFVGNVDSIVDLQTTPGLVSAEHPHFADLGLHPERQFFEAVIGAGSQLVRSTLKEVGFRALYGAAVVAIHRSGQRLDTKLGEVRLRPGDVLLVLGGPDFHRRYRDHGDFAVVAPLTDRSPIRTERARIVELMIVGLVLVAGTGVLDLLQASLIVAFALVAFRIVTPGEARRFVHFEIILLMASSFGIGTAVQQSGLAAEIARLMLRAFEPFGSYGILCGILAITMVLTEMLSNNAAAALMFPIGLAAAQALTLNPMPFAVVILFGSTLSFLTPIGYQTNTLVWGMGAYRYGDFARLGAPVTLAVLIATPPLVPVFFPLQ